MSNRMRGELKNLLAELNARAPGTRLAFDDLFDPGLGTIPIPFFGDLPKARVLTVGLNPSNGEIRGRGWTLPVDTETLYSRLTKYFKNPGFPPHPWFDKWEAALREIGVSYSDGTAAHVDLCPWPTRPMSNSDPDRFTALVTRSLHWFQRTMALAANLQLVLMAGAVNRKHYLNEFLTQASMPRNISLLGKVSRAGPAFAGYHQMRVADREFPVFFCSVSPSSRTPHLLLSRVRENRTRLMGYLRAP